MISAFIIPPLCIWVFLFIFLILDGRGLISSEDRKTFIFCCSLLSFFCAFIASIIYWLILGVMILIQYFWN